MNSRPALANNIPSRIWFILLLLFSFSGCEKDDICVEGDTPLMIVRFYDASDPEVFKQVNGLRIIGIGNGSPVDTFTDRTATDSIGLPLRLDANTTAFTFILNSADDDGLETGNIDTLNFQYDVGSQFISRACGYIGLYENLGSSLTADAENWIQTIEITNPIVQSIDSVHVKVFH